MELTRAGGAVVRRIYLLLIGALLVAAAVYFWSARHPPTYQATAQIVVTLHAGVAITASQLTSTETLAQTYAARALPEDIVDAAHLYVPARSSADIRHELTVAPVAGQSLLTITARDASPTIARDIANNVAIAFASYYSQQNLAKETALAQQEAALQSQLQQLNGKIIQTQAVITTAQAEGKDTTTLRQQLAALQTQQSQVSSQLAGVIQQRITPLADFWVASQATTAQRLGTDPRVSATFGAAAGLFAGICVALLLDLLDGTVRGPADTTRFAGLSTLATVRALPGEDDEPTLIHQEEYAVVSDSYEGLLRNLAFLDATRSLQTLLIVPCVGVPNLDQVGINLAITHALAGIRTLVVDANWQSPTLETRLGLPASERGFFTSLVVAATRPAAVLDAITPTPITNLFALPVGPLPPNLEDLLRSSLPDQLNAPLRDAFERVVVLAPADLRGTAGLQLAERMDGALVVARSGSTTGRELADVAQVLRRANSYLAGAVLVSWNQPRSPRFSAATRDVSSRAEPAREPFIPASSSMSDGVPLDAGQERGVPPGNLEYQTE